MSTLSGIPKSAFQEAQRNATTRLLARALEVIPVLADVFTYRHILAESHPGTFGCTTDSLDLTCEATGRNCVVLMVCRPDAGGAAPRRGFIDIDSRARHFRVSLRRDDEWHPSTADVDAIVPLPLADANLIWRQMGVFLSDLIALRDGTSSRNVQPLRIPRP